MGIRVCLWPGKTSKVVGRVERYGTCSGDKAVRNDS